MDTKGISLIEVLLYVAILAIVSGLFIGILATTTRVELREVANNEVSNQLNFGLQTIQRLVRESSGIIVNSTSPCTSASDTDVGLGMPQSCLKLRMKVAANDPTCIYTITESGVGVVKVVQGADAAPNQHRCRAATTADNITTNKVTVPASGLTFTKRTNYPGHDSVQIDLTVNYNTTQPEAQISRKLTTAVGRVSAATFDSPLIPGGTPLPGIGNTTARWENVYVNSLIDLVGNLVIGGTVSQGGNYDGGDRGNMFIHAPLGKNCGTICSSHGLACSGAGFEIFHNASLPADEFDLKFVGCAYNFPTIYGGLCFCN